MIQMGTEEKSWVSHKVNIWIVIKTEENKKGLAKVKIWIVMKKEKKIGFGQSKDLDYYEKGRKKMGLGQSIDLKIPSWRSFSPVKDYSNKHSWLQIFSFKKWSRKEVWWNHDGNWDWHGG